MWKRKTRLLITCAVFGTLTVSVVAKGTLQSSCSSSFTEHNLFGSNSIFNIVGDHESLSDVTHTNLSRTVYPEPIRRPPNEHSQLQYAIDTNVWRGITPLISTRAEVERVLGVPSDSLRQILMYENGTDKVDVLYAGSACEQTEVGRWNVSKDTVLRVKVLPQTTVLIKTLKLDRSKYQRIREAHPQNWVHYINQAQGIIINTEIRGGREEVVSLVYEPSSKQKALRCVEDARPM